MKKTASYCFLIRTALQALLLFTFANNVFAQVKFSAVASSTTIGKNERLQIDFKAENANVDDINPPHFKGFIVESGPFSQTGYSVINGNSSRYYSMTFVLRPTKVGKVQIGSATAVLDGKTYQSNPLSINVTEAAQGTSVNPFSPFGNFTLDVPTPQPTRLLSDFLLKKGENVQEKIAKNMFVKVDVDKTTCFVGEPVVATYKLYTRLKSESNLTKSPAFNGFSVIDLDVGNNFTLRTETLNGREYSVYVLRRVQLYPLQPGIAELESCEVDNTVNFLKAEYTSNLGADALQDLLNAFSESRVSQQAVESTRLTLQNKPVIITVKPLPENGKPAGFRGAVGNFKMTSWVVKDKMTTDDAGSLRININGIGNLHLVNAPFIEWPAGVEGFDPKAAENLDKTSVPVSGEKQYAYPFSISKKGKYTIPPIEFSYFDPKTSTYKILNSPVLVISVSKGTGNKAALLRPGNKNKSEPVDVLILLLYIGAAITVVVCASVFVLNRRKKNREEAIATTGGERYIEETQVIEEPVIPVSPLIVPQEKLTEGDAPAFFSSLNLSLKEYLSKQLSIPYQELNKKTIHEMLDKKGVNVNTSQLLCSLIDDIEMNLYAGPFTSNAQMHEVYEKANEVLGLLEKQVTGVNGRLGN